MRTTSTIKLAPNRPPNIVMIIADDITPHYHGCYGGPTPTPQLDELARAGIRFTRGFCNAALCCPSRWTFFTGLFAGRSASCHGAVSTDEPYLVSQNAMLDEDTPTLAKTLRKAGYFTGHIGKWHSRFDCSFLGESEPVIPLDDPDAPGVDETLHRRQNTARRVIERCAGFEHADRVFWGNISGREHPKLRHHNIGWLTDGARVFLEQAAQHHRPFYLHLANTIPHDPNPLLSLNADHRYTWGGKLTEAPQSHPPDDTVLDRLREAGLQTSGPIAGVNAGAIQLDDQVGIIRDQLRRMGELENTIFIYTADHGIPGKGSCHLTGQHLPLIVSWPETLPAGRVMDDLVSWVDIVPTLVEACGVNDADIPATDGYSLLSALVGQAPWPRTTSYHEMGWSRSIIKGAYHYIATRYPRSLLDQLQVTPDCTRLGIGLMFDTLNAPCIPGYFEPDQLYNITTDPLERTNLAHDPQYADILQDLKHELRTILATLPRPFPDEPDAFLKTDAYQAMLKERKEHMQRIVHYPTQGDVPAIWHFNQHDPDTEAE